jgi:hypothetical protein
MQDDLIVVTDECIELFPNSPSTSSIIHHLTPRKVHRMLADKNYSTLLDTFFQFETEAFRILKLFYIIINNDATDTGGKPISFYSEVASQMFWGRIDLMQKLIELIRNHPESKDEQEKEQGIIQTCLSNLRTQFESKGGNLFNWYSEDKSNRDAYDQLTHAFDGLFDGLK